MAKILKQGCAHKAVVWEDTCYVCASRLRMFENRDDPAVKDAGNCGAYFKEIRYVCPVCGYENETYAANSGEFRDINNDECRKRAKLGKTKREYITLTLEDLEELNEYRKEAEASDE